MNGFFPFVVIGFVVFGVLMVVLVAWKLISGRGTSTGSPHDPSSLHYPHHHPAEPMHMHHHHHHAPDTHHHQHFPDTSHSFPDTSSSGTDFGGGGGDFSGGPTSPD